MAIFEIQGPDGKTFEIDAPDQRTAVNAYKQHVGGMQSPDVGSAPKPPEPRSFGDRLGGAANAMLSDIDAGLQGVNPVSMMQAKPIGVIKPIYPGGKPMVDIDGVSESLENYPADKYVQRRGDDGQTYIYPRTEEVEEGRLASLGRLLGYGFASNLGPMAKAAKPTPRQQLSADADSLGIVPTLGMGSKTGAVVSGAMEANPFATGRLAQDTQRVAGEIQDVAGDIVSRVGQPTNNVGAGEALQRGADVFVQGTSKTADKLFSRVDDLIPETTRIAAPETAAALRDTLRGFEGTPEIASRLGLNAFSKLADELESGGLTWKAARQLRSDIGQSLKSQKGPLANMDEARLKLAYGKLSEDLSAAAEAAGAGQAWSRANQYYKARMTRVDDVLKQTLKADTPEKAFDNFMALTKKDSGRGSLAKLQGIKKSLPADDWSDVAATALNKLGEATAGRQSAAGDAFSPDTFLTNWNKMSPEAKVILSDGMDKGVKTELDALARVIERFKAAGGEKNFSNTGKANNVALFLLGSALDLGTTAGIAGGSVLSARAMTNRNMLRALNRAAARNDFTGLKRIANGQGPLAIEAQQVLRLTAGEEGQTQMSLQTLP